MKHYKYKLDHDLGLAPNPFGGYCTLAVCKSQIRKSRYMECGSWVFGLANKKLRDYYRRLIFCMRVEEKLRFEEYWSDPRFQYKKVVENGSLPQLYGDNIYHKDTKANKWIQENSAHSFDNGITNEEHRDTDLSGEFVLISKNFYYWGRNAIIIPDEFYDVICTDTRDRECVKQEKRIDDFVHWLHEQGFQKGILYGDPISWIPEYGI